MKISNDEAVRASAINPITAAIRQPHTPVPTVTKAAGPGAGPAAHIELSAQAQALSAATTASAKTEAAAYLPAVNAAPDIRTSLVDKLKAQVESGTYHVSGADIADQIVRRAQADKIQ